MSTLSQKTCIPCEGGVKPLDIEQAEKLLADLNDWSLNDAATQITKSFKFKNFLRTMSFVNALAWIANQENHHPDLSVSYNQCVVTFQTHAVNGLTENDFICAAKVDNL